jgi:hypothetical protein
MAIGDGLAPCLFRRTSVRPGKSPTPREEAGHLQLHGRLYAGDG